MGAGVDRLQREGVVEVDVGDHRDRRPFDDRLQRDHIVIARHGDAHEVRASLGDLWICSMVASRLAVSVLVIVCTATGAPPRDRHAADEDLALGCHGHIVTAGH